MAQEITPNLGLVIDQTLSTTAKQNLRKIDALAGKLNILDNSNLLLDSNNSIILSPATTLDIGQPDGYVTSLNIYADEINITGTNEINGLVYEYINLNFTGSSLESIEDHDVIISQNPDVIDAANHIIRQDNPHDVTAHQVGAYETGEVNALLATKADLSALIMHEADSDNPHETTAEQVGAYTISQTDALLANKTNNTSFNNHVNNTSNPHDVTAAQVGTYTTHQIDTLLANKADESALTSHETNFFNPHNVSAAQTGTYSAAEIDLLIASAGGQKVRVSDTDTTENYLADKVESGTGIGVTTLTDMTGYQTLSISNTDKGTSAVSAHNLAYDHGAITHTNRSDLDNVSGTNTGDETQLSIVTKLGYTPEDPANRGVANGYVPLDGNVKIDASYLPSTVMEYKGNWDPTTNTPTLIDGTGDTGDVYWVSAFKADAISGLTDPSMENFQIGNLIIYSGVKGKWEHTTPAAGVVSVDGMQGAVNLSKGDLSETTSSVLTISSGTDAVWGSGTTIEVKQSSSTQDGYLSSADWSTFNGKQNALGYTPVNKAGDTMSGNLLFDGASAKILGDGRNPTSNTAGVNLSVSAGGATVGATDKNGGDLNLSSGIATGTGGSNIYFKTATPDGAGTVDNTPSDKMTILGNGNVGIGQTVPTSKLQIDDSAAKTANYTAAALNATNTSTTAGATKTAFSINSTGTWTGTGNTNTGLSVNVSGGTTNYAATFMGGGVGIGSTTPATRLTIRGTSSGALSVFDFGRTSIDFQLGIAGTAGNFNPWAQAGDSVFRTNSTGTAVLFASGTTASSYPIVIRNSRVGIGVSTPSEMFSLNGDAARNIIMERHTVADTAGNGMGIYAGGATLGATDKNGGDMYIGSGIATGTGSSNMYFQTVTAGTTGTADNTRTTKMTLTGTGFLGIGNTPTTILDISGAFTMRGMAAPALSSAGTGRIYFDSTANKFKKSENGGAYEDLANDATKLPLAGGTMTGAITLDNLGVIFDTVGAAPGSPAIGQTWWDINLGSPVINLENNSQVSLTQDSLIRVRNDGIAVGYAALVYASDVSGHKIIIKPAIASTKSQVAGLQGWTTSSLSTSTDGYVKTSGILNNLNTNTDSDGNALALGDLLYLSASVAGGYTKVPPTNKRLVGIVMEVHNTQGKIMAMINPPISMPEIIDTSISSLLTNQYLKWNGTNWVNSTTDIDGFITNANYVAAATGEKSGFEDPAGIGISYDSGTQSVTITHSSGTIAYYIKGVRYTRSSPYTPAAHTDSTANNYYGYFKDDNTWTWETSFQGFSNSGWVYAVFVYYKTSDKFAIRECHGLQDWQGWQTEHYNIGTYRNGTGGLVTGGITQNSNTADAIKPLTAAVVLQDEDLPTTVPAVTAGATYTVVYFSGGSPVFSTGRTWPFMDSGTEIQFNPTASSLSVVGGNNRWVNYYGTYIPVTSDSGSQTYRLIWITGQAYYTSLVAAQAEDFRSLDLTGFSGIIMEFLPFIKLTIRRDSTYTNIRMARIDSASPYVTYLAGSRAGYTTVAGFSPSTAPATRYTTSLSWSGVGPYTMTILGTAHQRGTYPLVTVREVVSTTATDVILDDVSVDTVTGDVTLTSSENIGGHVIIL